MDNPQARLIPGFERYTIDSEGTVYSTKGEPKTLHLTGGGYHSVSLFTDDKPRWKRPMVHRLMAVTFLGDPNGLQVNHKNGIKTDNRLSNLELVTPSENMQHALNTGLNKCLGETHHFARLTEYQVRKICQILIQENRPQYDEIAMMFGVSQSAINNIAGKHRWRRVSDEYWLGKLHRLVERRRA